MRLESIQSLSDIYQYLLDVVWSVRILFCCKSWNIPDKLNQYHIYWSCGSLQHLVINMHDIYGILYIYRWYILQLWTLASWAQFNTYGFRNCHTTILWPFWADAYIRVKTCHTTIPWQRSCQMRWYLAPWLETASWLGQSVRPMLDCVIALSITLLATLTFKSNILIHNVIEKKCFVHSTSYILFIDKFEDCTL